MKFTFREVLHVLWVTLLLRCPNCEQGRTFNKLFKINPICPNCGVRFERESGESVGAMYINLVFAELFSIGGYFLFNTLLQPPFLPHVIFWLTFNILFVLLFYRHSRSLWIGISYLTGGVRVDTEEERAALAETAP